MSFFVARDRSDYRDDAMNGLQPGSQLSLDTARKLMWLSQLVYETEDRRKIEDILRAWQLTLTAFVFNPDGRRLSALTACAIVVRGHGTTIVSFAGTDPAKINDWITDLWALPSSTGMHSGFARAVEQVWEKVAAGFRNRPAGEALLFTGHSLGGTLAIIAAERANRELGQLATAVYTFGSPRPGGSGFVQQYQALDPRTFRFVHGVDLVATVPPSQGGLFHHVGSSIQCDTDKIFDDQTPISPSSDDRPDFIASAFSGFGHEVRRSLSGAPFMPIGTGLVGKLVGLSPKQIQDHVPTEYFRTLSIPIG